MEYLICSKKKNQGKVALQVCAEKCQIREECKEYRDTIATMEPETVKLEQKSKGFMKSSLILPDPNAQNLRALDAINRVLSIRTDIETKFLEIGQVLDEIFSNRYHLELGFKDQKDFCEQALDLKERTAIYLRNIYLWQIQLEIPRGELAEIGWTKVKEILSVAKTKESAKKWIEKAKGPKVTTETLRREVKVAQGKMTEDEAKKKPGFYSIPLYEEQREIVDLAFDAAQKATGSESRGYLFSDVICASFLADYPPALATLAKGKIIGKLLGRMEVAFEVNFKGEVIDGATGEIIIEAE